jgi:hypothetical protein
MNIRNWLKDRFNHIRNAFNYRFDSIIARSGWKLLCCLVAVVITALLLILCISFLIRQPDSANLWRIVSNFLEPGNFDFEDESIPHWWVLIVNLTGMSLLGGLLIATLNNLLERRIDKIKAGEIYYNFKSHLLVLGYNRVCINIIEQYKGKRIIILTSQNVPEVRREILSLFPDDITKNITYVLGNRTLEEDLKRLNPDKACEIIILGENEESDRDALNIECFEKVKKECEQNKAKCRVLLDYQSTYSIFQRADIKSNTLNFEPFNLHSMQAKKAYDMYPLDREGISYDSDKCVHLVVVGMSRLGEAMGVQASLLCHFPNFIRDRRKKTRITFIDENAKHEMYFLQSRYASFFDEIDWSYESATGERTANPNDKEKFTDVEWHFVEGRIESPFVRKRLEQWSKEPDCYLTIAICLKQPSVAIAAGLYLPECVYNGKTNILVRQATSDATLAQLTSKTSKPDDDDNKYKNVYPFGILNKDFFKNDDDLAAKAVNYIYAQHEPLKTIYETRPPLVPSNEADKRDAEKEWQALPTVKRWSNRYNAYCICVKNRSFGIDKMSWEMLIEQLELLAEVEHIRWLTEELLLGYRAPAPDELNYMTDSKGIITHELKDNNKSKFIHCNICSYADLKPEYDKDGNMIDIRDNDRRISLALQELLRI